MVKSEELGKLKPLVDQHGFYFCGIRKEGMESFLLQGRVLLLTRRFPPRTISPFCFFWHLLPPHIFVTTALTLNSHLGRLWKETFFCNKNGLKRRENYYVQLSKERWYVAKLFLKHLSVFSENCFSAELGSWTLGPIWCSQPSCLFGALAPAAMASFWQPWHKSHPAGIFLSRGWTPEVRLFQCFSKGAPRAESESCGMLIRNSDILGLHTSLLES